MQNKLFANLETQIMKQLVSQLLKVAQLVPKLQHVDSKKNIKSEQFVPILETQFVAQLVGQIQIYVNQKDIIWEQVVPKKSLSYENKK